MVEPEVIYEDENIVAVNKPEGLKVHGDDTNKTEKTLVDWVEENYPEAKGIGEDIITSSKRRIRRSGIVHRLDKGTSGVILIARNHDSFTYLKECFKKKKIEKTYVAIVYGNVNKEEDEINSKIGRSKKDFRLRAIEGAAIGNLREAVTRYKVIKYLDDFTYLEVYPETGRTHQIRVHLKSIGNPVVCDNLYAKKRDCPEILNRLALHALEISLLLPDGIRARFRAEEPEEFKEFLQSH
jgi:23S rRNA pseudouridine1911/1915/1917 synthase